MTCPTLNVSKWSGWICRRGPKEWTREIDIGLFIGGGGSKRIGEPVEKLYFDRLPCVRTFATLLFPLFDTC